MLKASKTWGKVKEFFSWLGAVLLGILVLAALAFATRRKRGVAPKLDQRIKEKAKEAQEALQDEVEKKYEESQEEVERLGPAGVLGELYSGKGRKSDSKD